MGWRIRGSLLDAVGAYALLLLFAFAMSWIGALIGLAARTVEVAQSVALIWMFPFTFISSAYISVTNLPGSLRAVADWNPFTTVADACRHLFANPNPPNLPAGIGWAADHTTLYSVGASVLIVAIFLPLAVSRYRKSASR